VAPGDSLGHVPYLSRPSVAALCLAAGLAVGACGTVETGPPVPTPTDFGGVAAELSKHKVTVTGAVSGDAGCTDAVLIPTAISVTASGLDQTEPVRIYLYIFRNDASFQKLRASIDACARSYVTDPATYESVDQSPFVLAGQGPWAPAFRAALRAGLEVAAGTGD
jgi:hypothetical protein